ncbi:NCAN [Mytilus coruscus]|uniref:NCAN n=1 Tax=Mytilus coruscus TaxID=42192 RepID=A0A6J8BUW7_MYTCO|nr:NCAN [Mytilus coruscus]
MCLRHCHRYKDCNAVNYLPQILKCQLLALTAQNDNLILDSEYMFANMTNWKMSTDSCWPTNPCKEDTRCLPTHSNGHACSTFVTPCTASPCIHGYCNITYAGYKCTCDAESSGVNCECKPCMPNPCRNGGTCTVLGENEYSCKCIPNTAGRYCQRTCDTGWVMSGYKCYYFSQIEYIWRTAKSYCTNKNGVLAEPSNSQKISFLRNKAVGFKRTFCLGGSDIRTEGTFLWNRNSRLISHSDWNPGQPDNGTDAQNQDCVCISSKQGYRWDDMDCEQQHQFICEKPYV